MTDTARPSQLKSRLILLLIVAMFFSSFFIAWGLRFAGWTPAGHKNFGELIQPPKDLSQAKLFYADSKPYTWRPEEHLWRIVVVPSSDCDKTCTAMTDTLFRVWETQGRHAERVEVLWFGAVPNDAKPFRKFYAMQPSAELAASLPVKASAEALPVYVIDPDGYLVMVHRPGFDPSGLRKDIARFLK